MNASPDTAADLMRYKKADLVERIVALQGRVDQWEEASTIQPILSNGLPYRYIDLVADAVLVVDQDANFVDLNPALCSQLGYSRAELLGMKVDDVLSAGEGSWQKRREAIEPSLRNGANVELACRRKDGTTITFDISARTLEDGRFLAFARDATERKQAEVAVRTSEAQLKHNLAGQEALVAWIYDITELKQAEMALLAAKDDAANARALLADAIEHSSDGFVLFDADDRLAAYNSKYQEFYGYSDDDLKPGITWRDLYVIDEQRQTIAWEGRLSRTTEKKNWHDFERKLSDGRWLDLHWRPTSLGGMVGIQVDITASREAREALVDSERRFRSYLRTQRGRAYLGC